MPYYEYHCKNCNIIFEIFSKIMASKQSVKCVKCGRKANKIISKTTFKLKGRGWAEDGYSSQK